MARATMRYRRLSVTAKTSERHSRRRIGAGKRWFLGVSRSRQLHCHVVEIKAGLVDVAEQQPAVGQRPQQLAAAVLAEFAPPGRAGSHHELEVSDGHSDHAVRFWAIERPHAAREWQKTGSSRYTDRDVVRCQSHGAIHICCRLRRQGLAVGERATLKCLASQEQPSIAPPY